MFPRRYWFTLLTVSVFTTAPLSFVAAADPTPSSPQATESSRGNSLAPVKETAPPRTSQPSTSASQRNQDDTAVTRNPEADRQDMEKRYPATTDPQEKPSDKSKEVGS